MLHRRVASLPTVVVVLLLAAVVSASTVVTELYDSTFVSDDWNRRHEVSRATVEAELVRLGYNFVFRPYSNVSDNAAAYEIMKREAADTDLFILHNTRFREAAGNISRDYPNMKFMTTPSVGIYGNYTYRIYGYLYQATWLAGITCGLMTKTNNVGLISLPFMRGAASYNNAFLLGAKFANPSVKVYVIQTDDVTGVLQERKAAELLTTEYKTDCNLGGTLASSYRRWDELNVYSIGTLGYDRYLGTDNTLFGAYYDFTSLYRKGLYGLANGSFPAGQIDWGTLGDVVNTGGYSPLIPVAVKRRIDVEYERIVNGSEKVFCGSRMSPPLNGTTTCLPESAIQTMVQWLPGFINPRNVTYNESITYIIIERDHPWAVVLQVLAAFSIVVCLLLALIVVVYRATRRIRIRAPVFMLIIILGCVLMFMTMFFLFGEPTVASCQLRPWLFLLGFGLAVGALVAKNVRIWRLFKNASMEVIAITNTQLAGYGVLPTLAIMATILIAWSVATPYVPVIGRFDADLAIYEFNIRCLSTESAPAIIALIFCLVLLAFGFTVAFYVKDVGELNVDVDESKQMGYAFSVTFIFGMAMIVVQFVNAFDALIEVIIFSIVIYICPAIILALIIGPVAIMWKKGTLDEASVGSGSSQTHNRKISSAGKSHKSTDYNSTI